MTFSYVRLDSFIYVTLLIHVWDMREGDRQTARRGRRGGGGGGGREG